MLTIFTIPKAFVGHNSIIQKNAIKAWQRLKPLVEIIVFGNDKGVVETASELGVRHVAAIEKNEYGTPLLNSAFGMAQKLASHDLLVYANADIIFFQDLIDAIKRIELTEFLICGRRWDLDVDDEIDFSNDQWSEKLLTRRNNQGYIHGLAGIDYFVFKRGSIEMPPFAVGRPGWDGWLLGEMRRKRMPVIDATAAITVIHQNHDYSHSQFGGEKRVNGPEWAENIRLAGGLTELMTLRDADWVLTKECLEKPAFPRRFYSILSLWYPWRLMLATKRKFW